jgi:hypothetical protein
MFLCIAALLQNFNIKPAGKDLPKLDATHCGLTRIPHDYWVKLEPK